MPQTGLNESLPGSVLNTAFHVKVKAPLMPAALPQNTQKIRSLISSLYGKYSISITFLTVWLFSGTFMYMITYRLKTL